MSATHKAKIYETNLLCPACFPVQMDSRHDLGRPTMRPIARPDGAFLLMCPRCKKVFEAPSREVELREGSLPAPPAQPARETTVPSAAPTDPRGPSKAEPAPAG